MSFGKQSKALIVHITESTVQVLLWEQNLLTLLRSFVNDESSTLEYTDAIAQYHDYPVILLADLIDESFRHDTIIHVSGSDRAALIKRKLDFSFRNTPYRIGKVTGRLDEGRRDDKLLMSAINKPDAINPWVKVLVAEKRAVQSLTSVAFMLRYYVALEKLQDEEHLLISNLEGNNSLRQSFFKKGQLLFSRLTTISSRNEVTLGSDIYLETLQVRQYLERIQFLSFDASLRVQLFSGYDDAMLQLEAKSSEVNQFEALNASALLHEMKVELNGKPGSPALYQLAKVLAGKQPENIYAQPQITRYHELNRFAAGLKLAAALILVAGVLFQLPFMQRIKDQWDQRDSFISRTRPLQQQYETLRQRFPKTDLSPSEMSLVVQTYDKLSSQSFNPVEALNITAAALAKSPGLLLTALDWELEAAPFVPQTDQYGAILPRTNPIQGVILGNPFLGPLLSEQTHISLTIQGEAYSRNSFREAQDQVDVMVESLRTYPGVAVFASQMPTDVRTDIEVSTTVDDGEVRAPFTLEVTITKPEPAAASLAGGTP